MHELGIIVHITKTLQSVAKENHLNEIGSVTLEVGEVSSIVDEDRDPARGDVLRSLREDVSNRRVRTSVPALRQLGYIPGGRGRVQYPGDRGVLSTEKSPGRSIKN